MVPMLDGNDEGELTPGPPGTAVGGIGELPRLAFTPTPGGRTRDKALDHNLLNHVHPPLLVLAVEHEGIPSSSTWTMTCPRKGTGAARRSPLPQPAPPGGLAGCLVTLWFGLSPVRSWLRTGFEHTQHRSQVG
jgi:hypothetical protein